MAKKILDAVHQTDKGLRNAGTMDAKTMREFDIIMSSRYVASWEMGYYIRVIAG